MNQLQTVLDAMEIAEKHLAYVEITEAIEIVKGMMQAEPTTHQFYGSDFKWCNFDNDAHYQNTVEDGGWVIRDLYTHPAPQAAPAWLPIESAPTDGSWIVVTSTHNSYYRAAIQYLDGTWQDCCEESHDDLMRQAATHWMPLIAAPAVKETK
jgi:hypothetical protein